MAENREVDVAVVGAGAAGLGAAKTFGRSGASFVVLEASHRIGGRAFTEEVLPGVPFDLGCHWLHSASINPFTRIADELGIVYSKEGLPRQGYADGRWNTPQEVADRAAFLERQRHRLQQVAEGGDDCSVWEVTERDHRWTGMHDYFSSLNSSHDVDAVSVVDLMAYRDTVEDWPVREGYGTLIARFGADVPVSLNAAVHEVDWSGPRVKLATARGVVTAHRALITVSTGVLGAGDIRFTPPLPQAKLDAVAHLPLGGHNRICLAFDRDVFGPDAPRGFTAETGDDVPMAFNIRPFGFDYVVGVTGGRFADWLERAGQQASLDCARTRLEAVFGSGITRHVVAHVVTAWRGDPWVRGAYSAAVPGHAHQRSVLAEPVDDRLWFAGEATSPDFYATAHGAYLSGVAAAQAMA